MVTLLVVAALLGGCAVLRPGAARPQVSAGYRPVTKATVWPAPGGNAATCDPSGPGRDSPAPRTPTADTLKVRNKTLRQVLATMCSFSIPVPKTSTGASQDPLPQAF
jgi:hypothetical protein